MVSEMALRASNVQVGDTAEQIVVDGLTRTQLVMYAGASCDFNPLHTDEVYATQAAGFPSVFGHGMLTMALTGKAVTDYVGDGRLRSFGGRFRDQVWPGDTLTTCLKVTDVRNVGEQSIVILDVTTVNQNGATVFIGSAQAVIDQ
ncbi:MaoC/PaaZ C-terminal domain-containing protein [Mycobacterium sp. CVI_P3]|uniref:MaoC/PaaZ C-terminal domain-containing protein n=1 Tax=Mycobacterium pinniadriaticum TaxID=2994102 RepID=A0ABT3SF71_9MYCO|nr:MaoC/PaaZ C-terminal domain-containing protein [Mycobacterium pinniadriaticum]MCX2931761.1 MaoC/PaaZ C-terminal domain-containing protein [Mycobacterium pinniadriaticum]MCX2938164.1 MaoC/PaaZ C-terminal domain-containing protein [Mycobacterium pinniadriaticum]